ncbi:Nn.00g089840.m01.CDS01 [Neocucurbitaria sp. VM-36]
MKLLDCIFALVGLLMIAAPIHAKDQSRSPGACYGCQGVFDECLKVSLQPIHAMS